jgi:hypothetical protein
MSQGSRRGAYNGSDELQAIFAESVQLQPYKPYSDDSDGMEICFSAAKHDA